MIELVIFLKGSKKPIGSLSSTGKTRKVAEGRWIPVTAGKTLPKRVTDKVKVPPAWADVEYFSDPKAKLLVKGVDAKGRIQYVYNPKHVTAASQEKFARMNDLNDRYDTLVNENEKNAAKGMAEAECLVLIMETGIRPGSEKNTKAEKEAYGATTLEGRHVKPSGSGITLEFTGKKGVELSIPVKSPKVVSMLKRRKKSTGERGRLFDITGDQLLRYSKSLGNDAGFQSKDFRTYLGTETAMQAMEKINPPTSMTEYKKTVKKVGEAVAEKLGNTPRVALSSYVNPAIFEEWRRKVETA